MGTTIAPRVGACVKVTRGGDVFLGTVESDSIFTIGGRDGFHVNVHNHNGAPIRSSLFVSYEQWALIPL